MSNPTRDNAKDSYTTFNPLASSSQTLPPPAHDETSNKGRKRKFPGPAGLLIPEESSIKEGDDSNTPIVCSQIPSTQSVCETRQWCEMMSEFSAFANRFNIKWIRAISGELKEDFSKCPFLAAQICGMSCNSKQETCVTLKDNSGEIQAIVSGDLVKMFADDFIDNSVVVIEKFGVIFDRETGSCVLNVTNRNFVTLFSAGEHRSVSRPSRINNQRSSFDDVCVEELIREYCKPKRVKNVQPKAPTSSGVTYEERNKMAPPRLSSVGGNKMAPKLAFAEENKMDFDDDGFFNQFGQSDIDSLLDSYEACALQQTKKIEPEQGGGKPRQQPLQQTKLKQTNEDPGEGVKQMKENLQLSDLGSLDQEDLAKEALEGIDADSFLMEDF